MTRRFLFLCLTLAIFASSCNQGTKNADAPKADTVLMAVKTFLDSAGTDRYTGKPLWIEGTVLHTCKHGGKRMFLVDGNDSIRVEVTTGNNIPKFDESLIGSRVRVLGILKEERVDNKYLNEWEAEIRKPSEEHSVGIHSGARGHEDRDTQEKLAEVNSLREDLKKSGKDHLSFYSIEAISFTIQK
jgi:hypothetical protein